MAQSIAGYDSTMEYLLEDEERLLAELRPAHEKMAPNFSPDDCAQVKQILCRLERLRALLKSNGYSHANKNSPFAGSRPVNRTPSQSTGASKSRHSSSHLSPSTRTSDEEDDRQLPHSRLTACAPVLDLTEETAQIVVHQPPKVPGFQPSSENASAFTKRTEKGNWQPSSHGRVYSRKNLIPACPGTKYRHIVRVGAGGPAVALECYVCKTNCSTNNDFLGGSRGYMGHVVKHKSEASLSLQQIFEKAEAKGCLHIISETDIRRINAGEHPEQLGACSSPTQIQNNDSRMDRSTEDITSGMKENHASSTLAPRSDVLSTGHAFVPLSANRASSPLEDDFLDGSAKEENIQVSRKRLKRSIVIKDEDDDWQC